jgi:hypothetical protein
MTRILSVAPEDARGIRRFIVWFTKRRYGGFLPGVVRVMLPDLTVGLTVDTLYRHLHLRKSSPISRLQREMLATVVNGKIGGAA